MSIPSVKAAVASVPSAVSAVGTVTALRQPMLAAFVPTRSFAVAPAAITTAQQVAAIPAGVTVTRSRFADIIKKHKPTTNGQRHHISLRRDDLWSGKPIRQLTVAIRKKGGRNNLGRITSRRRGGGHRQRYRLVDFKRSILDVEGTVQRLEYDPNRNAHIALVRYPDGRLQYIIAPQKLKAGDSIMASRSREIEIKPGNAMPLAMMPIGTVFHCMELQPGRGAQYARSAGASCQLIEKENTGRKGHALVRITSKEQRLVPLASLAVVGEVSNPLHHIRSIGKAGRNRWLGWRPIARGLARNPVDHPHGGGGGKGRPGRPSCSPTAILAKGYKTRSPRKNGKLIVVGRGGPQKIAASKARAKKATK